MTVLTNLATNPSFESVEAGSTVVRENLFIRPNFYASTLGAGLNVYWAYSGQTNLVVDTPGLYGDQTLRVSRLSSPGGLGGAFHTLRMPDVVAGADYTASFWVLSDISSQWRARLSFADNTSYPGNLGASTPDEYISVPANVWTRVSATGKAPSGAVSMWFIAESNTPYQTAQGASIDAILVEQSSTPGEYFDGSTPDALGWGYAWTGTANVSTSTAKAAMVTVRENLATNPSFEASSGTVTVRTNLATNPSFEAVTPGGTVVRENLLPNPSMTVGSGGWSTNVGSQVREWDSTQSRPGAASLGSFKASNNFDVAYALQYWNGTAALLPPVVAGNTYTLSAWVKADIADTFYALTRWRNEALVQISQDEGANVVAAAGEWARVSVTAVAPVGATRVHLAFQRAGAVSGSFMWVDDVLLEKSSTLGDYFDGSTPGALGWDYGWTGTANESTSVAKAAVVAVRENLFRHPSAEGGDTTGWGSLMGATVSSSTEQFHSGTNSYKVVTPGVTGREGIRAWASNPESSGLAGSETISAWVKAPLGADLELAVDEWTTSGGFISGRGVSVFEGTGDWQRVSWTASKVGAANVLTADVRVPASATPQAITFYVDDVLGEASPVLGDYFDGSTPAEGDFTYAWTGTENESTSVQQGVKVASAEQGVWNKLHVVRSSEWSKTGGSSLRVVALGNVSGPTNDTSARVAGSRTTLSGEGVTFEPGKTYTAIATARLSAAQTGLLDDRARCIDVSGNVSATFATLGTSTQPANAAGVYTQSVTFTVPVGATWTQVRLYNGAHAGNGDVWWDDFMLIEGDYSGPYFDGDTPASGDFTYAWTGEADESTSVQQGVGVAGVTGGGGRTLYQSQEWSASGERSVRIHATGTSSHSALGMLIYTPTDFVDGQTYTATAKLRLAEPQVGSIDALARRLYLTSGARSDQAPNTAGEHEVRFTFTYASGDGALRAAHGADASNSDVWWDDFMLLRGTYTGDYFDGDTLSADGDLSYAWTGTPHASTSVRRGVAVTGFTPGNSAVVGYQSGGWSSSGSKSLRVTPLGGDDPNNFLGMDFSGVEGRTYTVKARLRLTQVIGRQDNYTRMIDIRVGATSIAASDQAPNLPGVYDLSVTFVAPAQTVTIRLNHRGSAGSGDMWWDNFLIIEGDYSGPYFDGDTFGAEWTGTPHTSTSEMSVPFLTFWDGTTEKMVAQHQISSQ